MIYYVKNEQVFAYATKEEAERLKPEGSLEVNPVEAIRLAQAYCAAPEGFKEKRLDRFRLGRSEVLNRLTGILVITTDTAVKDVCLATRQSLLDLPESLSVASANTVLLLDSSITVELDLIKQAAPAVVLKCFSGVSL